MKTIYRCRACGAEIIFIRTGAGKSMPCDAQEVYYKQSAKGRYRVVTFNGEVLNCDGYDAEPREATGLGYVPHWATCTDAARFRSRDK